MASSEISGKVDSNSYDIDTTKIIFEQYDDPLKRLRIAERLINSYSGRKDILVQAYQILLRQKEQTPDLQNVDLEFAHLYLTSGLKYIKDCINTYNIEQAEVAKNILLSLSNKQDVRDRKFEMLFDIFMSEKNYIAAESAIINASNIDVDKKLIERKKALFYYKKGEYESVINIYNELLDENPDFADDYVLMKSYTALGNVDLLHEYYKKILQITPDDAWALGNYATFLLYTMGDIDGAVDYGYKALKRMEYPLARNVTGLALLIKASQAFDSGEQKMADEYYRQAENVQYNDEYVQKNCREYCSKISNLQKFFSE